VCGYLTEKFELAATASASCRNALPFGRVSKLLENARISSCPVEYPLRHFASRRVHSRSNRVVRYSRLVRFDKMIHNPSRVKQKGEY